MNELFFGPLAAWFTVPALLGTAFFSLRMVLMFVGGDLDGDMDVDFDVDVDLDVDANFDVDGDGVDSDEAFRVLSVQTIAAFLMGFGWGGLGALQGAGWPLAISIAFALATGAGMVWLLGSLFKVVFRLQSSGNIPIYNALEMQGSVYATVPAKGQGKGRVRLVIDDRERFYTAITEGEAIPSKETVRVVSINEDNSVTVTRAFKAVEDGGIPDDGAPRLPSSA